MMSSKRFRVPEPLVYQCQYYILMHLEEFPVNCLSLLPLSTRKELLWQLPVADVCLLEDTKFTEGLDMAAYWKDALDEQAFGVSSWNDKELERYIQEWDNTEYEREILYGLLTTYDFGSDYLRDGDFYFRSPHVEDKSEFGMQFRFSMPSENLVYMMVVSSNSHLATLKQTTNMKRS